MKKSKFAGLPKVSDAGAPEPRGPGRPKGGAGTSPDAVPVTLRISSAVYKRAQIAVIESTDGQPLSKIVEDLLTEWLKAKGKNV